MERERDEMSGLFWKEGGVFNYAESPEPPAPGRVILEHDAPVPRQPLDDQHRVAVAVEPVPPLHGISIDGEDLLAARKRRREEQQRRLRQMEIGDEARHQLEAMTRADEQVGLTFSGPHDPIVQTQ